MLAEPAVSLSTCAPDLALTPRGGPASIARFLDTIAPVEVLRAVRHCLPPGGADPVLRLVRAKVKPGRKLTAEYGVALPARHPVERHVSVAWVAPGATAPGPAVESEAEARRRRVLAPFRRAWIGSDDERMSMSVSPVDHAFPQLVRLHDRRHLVDVLRATGATTGVGARLTVETVRYRQGQRHVLRVGTGLGRPAWFVKVYRDDTGRSAVHAAAHAATVLAGSGDPAAAVPSGGVYVAEDRAAWWPEVAGTSLADVVVLSGPPATDAVRAAGCALRLLHGAPLGRGLRACPDALAQAAETVRTAQLLEALHPVLGSQLRDGVARVLDVLSGLPAEPPTVTHGDFKCDNLVVNGSRVHLLDFDRCGLGDPAADLGKFLADLRWWAGQVGHPVAPLHEAFLDAYGVTDPARLARARAYDTLLQLRMAARRISVQGPDWEGRVARAIAAAVFTLAEEP
jgi:Ser/Thr protein kinase RdoA (MazF antagonist)